MSENQQPATPKRKRGRQKKTANEMPKRTRGRSQRTASLLGSSQTYFENSYSREKFQKNKTEGETIFNIDETKTILRSITESLVTWIIEGVKTVDKENVLQACREVQTITSLLHERKASAAKSKSARQRETLEPITSLLESANFLTMVIDKYQENIEQKEQEDNRYDLSFADMFPDDIEDTESTACSKQDNMTMKSILKASNIDSNIAQKKISFAEKATNVYQDNETSQISLAKSSPNVKNVGGNAKTSSAEKGNSEINHSTPSAIQTSHFRPQLNVQTPKQLDQKVELMKPPQYDTSVTHESPSIIESSFLNDCYSRVQANNSTINLKKFKPKMRNMKEIQDPSSDKASKKIGTCDIFQSFLLRNSTNVAGDLENTEHPNTYDTPSNIFSDELVKTLMLPQTTGSGAEENAQKASLPFQDFVLTLPESSTSEESIDLSFRMAVNIVKGSGQNSKVDSTRNNGISKVEDKTEWTWRPENSTEIIPSSEPFGRCASGWMETQSDNVRDNYYATSENSSLNVSLLFDETNEASWIPGTFDLQNNSNVNTDGAQIVTKQIPNDQKEGLTKHETKCEANAANLQNPPPQEQTPRFCEPPDNKKLDEFLDEDDELNNATKAIKVPNQFESAYQQETRKEQDPKTFTVMENAYMKPLVSDHTGVPSGNSETAKSIPLAGSGNVLRTDTKHYGFDRQNKDMNNLGLDELKRKKSLLIEPSFNPTTQSNNAFYNQQPILSFSDLNKLHSKQEFKKTLGYGSHSRELHDALFHEPRTQSCTKKIVLQEPVFQAPTQNNNTYDDQQHLFSNSKRMHLEMELMKTRGNSSGNNEIDILSYKPEPENCPKKNILKEQVFNLRTQNKTPIGDFNQEIKLKTCSSSRTSMQQAQDGMKNIKNRFQETLLAGHWLKSGLQQNTKSSLFPSLNPFSNSEVNTTQVNDNNENTNSYLRPNDFDGIRLNQEICQKLGIDADGQRSPNQGIDMNTNINQLIQTQHISNNVQEKLNALWVPRNSSLFSAFSLSETEPVNEQHMDLKHTNKQYSTKTQPPGWDLNDKPSLGIHPSVLSTENTIKTSGISSESGAIPKRDKSLSGMANVDGQNMGNSLFTGNPINSQLQSSMTSCAIPSWSTLDDTELVKSTSNDNQSSILTNRDNIQHGRRNVPSEALACFSYSSKHVQPNQTGVLHQGSHQNDLANRSWLRDITATGTNYKQPSGAAQSSRTPTDNTALQFAEPYASAENFNRLSSNTQDAEQGGDVDTEKNSLNVPRTKPRNTGPKKRTVTSKRKAPKAQNEFIYETQASDRPIPNDSQKGKADHRKPKVTRKKSPIRRQKASALITGSKSHEELGKAITINTQKEDSTMNNFQPSDILKETPLSDGQPFRNVSPNPFHTAEPSNVVFLRPFDVKRNVKKPGELNLTPADSVASDPEHDSTYFFNPNVSKNGQNNQQKYQSRGFEEGKGYFDMDGLKNNALQNNQKRNCEEIDLAASSTQGEQMRFIECDELSWDEFPECINADESFCSRDSKNNNPGEEISFTHAKTCAETPMGYLSLTQLSWGQSPPSEIPNTSMQSCTTNPENGRKQQTYHPARSANSRSNTLHEETYLGNITHAKTNSETLNSGLTQLSWGQSATCEILPVPSQPSTSIFEIGLNQQTSTSRRLQKSKGSPGYGQFKNVTTQPANTDSVFKQPFTPSPTVETNQPLSFTEFMKDICVSSTENVLNSASSSPKKLKTEEEEIEEILNGIEFVRMPQESELIEASTIEELINDQTFVW